MPNLCRNVAFGIGVVLVALGCYSPNIAQGGFICGADGGCPDKFHCASNNRCYQGDASIDMLPVCNSDATVKAKCATQAALGQSCNPICQTGCNCGWCGVVGGATACLTGSAGKKDVGGTCDPSKDSECLPGLYCQPENCPVGTTTGSCYRLCDPADTTDVCGTGSACNVTAKKNGGGTFQFLKLCSAACDPVSQTSPSCPSPFACYPSGATTTECDCAGTKGTGISCGLAEDCVPGETCVGPMNGTICRPVCTATAPCASGTTCNIPGGAASGTCM